MAQQLRHAAQAAKLLSRNISSRGCEQQQQGSLALRFARGFAAGEPAASGSSDTGYVSQVRAMEERDAHMLLHTRSVGEGGGRRGDDPGSLREEE